MTSDDDDLPEKKLVLKEEYVKRNPDHKATVSERQVLVRAKNGKCIEELIRLLFTSKDKCNGGPIQEVISAADGSSALITFVEKQGQFSLSSLIINVVYTLVDWAFTLFLKYEFVISSVLLQML